MASPSPESAPPQPEAPAPSATHAFTPPSISAPSILSSETYTHLSPIPTSCVSIPCVLGIDEAGRGPVLGPMVYACAYLPLLLPTTTSSSSDTLLRTHAFDDSKKLTPAFRTALFSRICAAGTDLHAAVGWGTTVMSARDISAGMFRGTSSGGGGGGEGSYNLNAQAHDATAALIRAVVAAGVQVAEIYVDTVGSPATYQRKLAALFPQARVTVAKKADSLYPVVSAASVVAKVTRDYAVETVLGRLGERDVGSGYPGDEKTKRWLRGEIEPVFGWDARLVRFSWGTAKNLLEDGAGGVGVEWPDEEDGAMAGWVGGGRGMDGWWGRSVTMEL